MDLLTLGLPFRRYHCRRVSLLIGRHAGASGYIAVMSLCGFAANFIRPTALVLNILVATIAAFQFWRAGHFSWALFWPFALLSVPAAYLGGYLSLPSATLKLLIGGVLLFSAARLFFRERDPGRNNGTAAAACLSEWERASVSSPASPEREVASS
jgi:uncharacterized membrane protein YfcA